MNTKLISTKTVLITGVGRGIGKALAEKFLAENYNVIGTSQTGSVDFEHKNLKVFKLDLSVSESINACCKDISLHLKKSGTGVDILINNAGIVVDEEETHVFIDKLRQTLEVNLIGTIDFTEHLLSFVNENGHIVNTSSAAGSLTDEQYADRPLNPHHNPLYRITRTAENPYFYPSYKISKTALNMYTTILAQLMTYEKRKITVSSVHPGWVRTDMGGSDAPMLPAEAAKYIYERAISHPETGCFWFKGQKYPW